MRQRLKEAAANESLPDKPDGRGGSAANTERQQLQVIATYDDSSSPEGLAWYIHRILGHKVHIDGRVDVGQMLPHVVHCLICVEDKLQAAQGAAVKVARQIPSFSLPFCLDGHMCRA